MANITAADVNKLRKSTGAGMMDCKNALVEADGDFEKAIELNPNDPYAASKMITVAKGLSFPKQEMEKYFQERCKIRHYC